MNEPEFWAHVLGICNLLVLHVNTLPKKKKPHNGLKQTDYMLGVHLTQNLPTACRHTVC